jgi:hypothetical protein
MEIGWPQSLIHPKWWIEALEKWGGNRVMA